MEYAQEIDYFRLQLRENADPQRAQSEQSYLKSTKQFYGVKVPILRSIAQAWLKAHKSAEIDDVAGLAEALWQSDWHEERSLATMLLEYRGQDLTLDQMPLIERMIHEATTWAHLDAIAGWVIGPLIDHDPATLDYLSKWAESDNFWVRRAAVLSQLTQFRRGEGDLELFSRIVVPMFDEGSGWTKDERFFIRKAIGWALRELATRQPDFVLAFVQQHRDQMSGLSFHEATRKLPAELKAQL